MCSAVDFQALAQRPLGGLLDLVKVQANLSHCSLVARAIVQDLVAEVGEILMLPHVRLIVATRLLSDAMLYLDGAFVMHVRADMKVKPALVLLRSALEVVGRAAVVALGTADEVDSFANAGERIPSPQAVAELDALATRFNLPAAGPVYGWLCGFSHYDVVPVHAEPTVQDVYARLAYVSVIAARLAEIVSGTQRAESVSIPALRAMTKPDALAITEGARRRTLRPRLARTLHFAGRVPGGTAGDAAGGVNAPETVPATGTAAAAAKLDTPSSRSSAIKLHLRSPTLIPRALSSR